MCCYERFCHYLKLSNRGVRDGISNRFGIFDFEALLQYSSEITHTFNKQFNTPVQQMAAMHLLVNLIKEEFI